MLSAENHHSTLDNHAGITGNLTKQRLSSIIYLLFILTNLLFTSLLFAQNNFSAIIKDSATHEPIIGVSVYVLLSPFGATSDSSGLVLITNLPAKKYIITFHLIGYAEKTDTFSIPSQQSFPVQVFLREEIREMDEVIISSTRSSRTIDDNVVRVEVISGEELEEKGNMKPGDIRMMLNESTGIQTQQTSPTSYNSGIRIQGLDGKYTQILRDGVPVYSGFSGGLSLLQTIPLDLKQVEVIKGASSTLYGGGAIAGLVNLISKTPSEKPELNLLLNGTSAMGLDASAFYSKKFKKTGTTLFGSYNTGRAYDPAHIGLSAIPEFKRYTFNPGLYIYFNKKTTLHIQAYGTYEDRKGGDMEYIAGRGDSLHSYFEINNTIRISTLIDLKHSLNDHSDFTVKLSETRYSRRIDMLDYKYGGLQFLGFGEVVYRNKRKKSDWVAGINYMDDRFQPQFENHSTHYYTIGAFVQKTTHFSSKFFMETGLRGDVVNFDTDYLLPQISFLLKLHPKLTFRLGGGLGYKLPTIFTEESEAVHYRNILPIDILAGREEKSAGVNFDLNYKASLTELITFSINQLFFYTNIMNPLEFSDSGLGYYVILQHGGDIKTKGIETNIKLTYLNLKLFVGYTFSDVNYYYDGKHYPSALVAKNRLNNVLMYEVEGKLKMGLEAYYYSPQKLNDGTTGKDYWLCGFMAEKLWKHFSLFVNFENIFDVRQTKFENIYTGTITNPNFRDIYAPLDGFLVNGGIKMKL